MDSPLFDHDLDGPPHLGAADVRVRRETDAKSGKGPAGGPKPRMEQAGDRPGIGWIEGVPVCELLGGRHGEDYVLYRAISQQSPEQMAAKVAG
ncbi:hypothetical protein AB1L30_00275 [Bremerella sp. JC817]|uniref:hypothetical protein n=1 Tax=Bremerella sp. JC817 TaxID=3231756 RepID=UPI0034592516